MGVVMDFEEWMSTEFSRDYLPRELAKLAWDYQQKIIDDFKQANNDLAKAAIRPDGYVLVPVEPTEKMEEAGLEVHPWDYTEDMQKIYKAMITAAQEEE